MIGDGIKMPQGSRFAFSPWLLHHDEELWKDPWKFDPERFSPENKHLIEPMAFLPFGGKQIILGSVLSHFHLLLFPKTSEVEILIACSIPYKWD